MTKSNDSTVSDKQVRGLRRLARLMGDYFLVDVCSRALSEKVPMLVGVSRSKARSCCAQAI